MHDRQRRGGVARSIEKGDRGARGQGCRCSLKAKNLTFLPIDHALSRNARPGS